MPLPEPASEEKKNQKPPCPKILTGQARKHWRYLVKCLAEDETLEPSDQGTIMSAAIAYGEAHQLQEEANDLRELRKQNPQDPSLVKSLMNILRNQRQFLKNLVEFEAKLCLNPNARARKKTVAPTMPRSKRERLLS